MLSNLEPRYNVSRASLVNEQRRKLQICWSCSLSDEYANVAIGRRRRVNMEIFEVVKLSRNFGDWDKATTELIVAISWLLGTEMPTSRSA